MTTSRICCILGVCELVDCSCSAGRRFVVWRFVRRFVSCRKFVVSFVCEVATPGGYSSTTSAKKVNAMCDVDSV